MDVNNIDNNSLIYKRQTILKEVGPEGQQKIFNAKILVVGAGGLGSPLIQYIAAAGVLNIGIIDNDTIAIHNLQRQVLYNHKQIGKSKAECAKEYALKLNPHAKPKVYPYRLTNENASQIISNYDIVADCSDNLPTRYVIDENTKKLGKPFVYASLCEFEGKIAIFNQQSGTSYSDIFPYNLVEIEQFKQPDGIIGAFAGVVGAIQALELIKLILGISTLTDKMLLINGLNLSFQTIKLK